MSVYCLFSIWCNGSATRSHRMISSTFLLHGSLTERYSYPGYSIRCYQCNSTSNEYPFQCNEFLTGDLDLQPVPCDDVYGAQYCVKHIGRFEGKQQRRYFIAFAWETNTVAAWRKLTLLTIIFHMDKRIILHRSIEHADNPALNWTEFFPDLFNMLEHLFIHLRSWVAFTSKLNC